MKATITISEKDFFSVFRGKNTHMINMVIINTKIVLYMKRSCGTVLRINVSFTYNEMLNDEYDSETTLEGEHFEARV